MLNKSATGDVRLHLYTNNRTPAEGDALVSYTESSGAGYASILLTGSSWTVATVGGTTSGDYAQQTFTYSGAEPTIYGYYVTTKNAAGDTIVLWANKFTNGPYVIPSGGGSIRFTPKVRLN